jgi:hypothetical protein
MGDLLSLVFFAPLGLSVLQLGIVKVDVGEGGNSESEIPSNCLLSFLLCSSLEYYMKLLWLQKTITQDKLIEAPKKHEHRKEIIYKQT